MNQVKSNYISSISTNMGSIRVKDSVNTVTGYCHGIAAECGWWGDDGKMERNTTEMICLMHSELSEAMEADRKNLMDDHLPHRKGLEVELADALIRIHDFAGRHNLDLGGAVAEKLQYNTKRADHKPENRAKEGGKKY